MEDLSNYRIMAIADILHRVYWEFFDVLEGYGAFISGNGAHIIVDLGDILLNIARQA